MVVGCSATHVRMLAMLLVRARAPRMNIGELVRLVVGDRLCLGRRRRRAIAGRGLVLELLRAGLMPLIHDGVGLGGEDILGQLGGKCLTRLGVLEVPVLDRELQEGHMLLGPEQDLERLPAREASLGESGDGGRGVVLVSGLYQHVLAAGDLPDGGDGGIRPLLEEGVIVATDGLVEGGELGGRQMFLVLVTDFVDNVLGDGAQQSIELVGQALVLLEHVGVLDGRRGLRFSGGRAHGDSGFRVLVVCDIRLVKLLLVGTRWQAGGVVG
jgi:hypothetical protein